MSVPSPAPAIPARYHLPCPNGLAPLKVVVCCGRWRPARRGEGRRDGAHGRTCKRPFSLGCVFTPMSLCVAQGNIPCRGEVCSREFDWNSMCEAMPFWKGQEMKRSYYSCITCKWWKDSRIVALSVSLTRKVSLLQTYAEPCRICSCFSCASCTTLAPAPPLVLVLVLVWLDDSACVCRSTT